MPFICRSTFERHRQLHESDDNLHVQAISNPVEAAQTAALKLVMNTHLREKLEMGKSAAVVHKSYLETILQQNNLTMTKRIIQIHDEPFPLRLGRFVISRT